MAPIGLRNGFSFCVILVISRDSPKELCLLIIYYVWSVYNCTQSWYNWILIKLSAISPANDTTTKFNHFIWHGHNKDIENRLYIYTIWRRRGSIHQRRRSAYQINLFFIIFTITIIKAAFRANLLKNLLFTILQFFQFTYYLRGWKGILYTINCCCIKQ